ncbi:C-5 cytosine-specific DNA methylase [uncultured phage_MedDCM-OCT-S45-C18]|uniref:C-5 cytosine-specific DNA methylase n=1 Tax=uncultured phage_MedDCM-OCT-S45-C18 TaxID=2741072 RepID=A0A6S4P8J5_9CAUD|nr:C-5 cytosine-specific DNA methylase [uncultured phage_MedDCM-OCT-S45-C18]BAQ94279.1 C-5 cytosine-specific DNA methylase [uncultured phage_MedDCM-OCT-S45-C18]
MKKEQELTIRGRKVVQQGNRLVVEVNTGRGKAFANISKEELTTATRKLGSNRGKTRLWLEGNILESQGWHTGDKFDVILIDGVLKYVKNPNGKRKVAGKPGRPIIDTNTDKISQTLNASPGEVVNVIATAEAITIQK